MRRPTLAAALLITALSSPSFGQSAAEHEAHHPQQKDTPAAPQPSPLPETKSGAGQGRMGGGMMGGSHGMMGPGGTMNMMGGNMPMMDMMQMMGSRRAGCGMGGMGMIDRVEGRIAFLRTELKITEAQTGAWNTFADALRVNAKSLGEVLASMTSQMGAAAQSLVERLTVQEKWLAARLEGMRAIKSPLTNLIGSLSDDQKKTADELLALHIGMNAMICAMQGGAAGMNMGMGQMQPGKPAQ